MSEDQIIIKPQKGKQELSVNLNVDVMIYGGSAGSGKSRALLMKPLRFMDDPNFHSVMFRRTNEALKKPGSLWPEAKKLYNIFPQCVIKERDKEAVFEEGAIIKFDGLQQEGDAEANYQGSQLSMAGFDELTHFEQSQFVYILGRLRSEAEGNSFCMATCNPDPDSWVLDWVLWYLDDEGFPVEEKCGVVRYFVLKDEKPVFADTKEELEELYPHLCFQANPYTGEMIETPPMSFTFIGATIFDNPALIASNPQYLSNLKSQSEVNRKRLLDGNWFAREEGSSAFMRTWLIKAKDSPEGTIWCRAYDKASKEPSEENRYPDFTASTKLGRCPDGNFYIRGDYHEDFVDKDSKVYGRFRKRPGERDRLIAKQAELDGTDCQVVFAKDPGSAGESEYVAAAKALIPLGFSVSPDPMPSNKSKMKRYEPFSSASENGFVYIIESSFPNKDTLDHWYKENEAFDGERSTSSRKDDLPDSTASAYNYVSRKEVLPKFGMPTTERTTNTRIQELKKVI